jgi:hypothetical protein
MAGSYRSVLNSGTDSVWVGIQNLKWHHPCLHQRLLALLVLLFVFFPRCASIKYPHTTGITSSATPIKTTKAQAHNQCSSEDQDVSEAVSAILKADSSMRDFCDKAQRVLLIQFVAVAVIGAVAVVYLMWGGLIYSLLMAFRSRALRLIGRSGVT